MIVNSFYKESENGNYRADIHKSESGYSIEYYSPTGNKIKNESFAGKSIHYVESAALNWISGIKTLNG